jgi:hypothetical protein
VSDRIGDWFLGRHPVLPAMRLVAPTISPLGWLLGYPINEAGTLLTDGEMLHLPPQVLASTGALEAFIYSFGGRFAAGLIDAGQPRFYVDPFGSLSAVHCAHQGMVA